MSLNINNSITLITVSEERKNSIKLVTPRKCSYKVNKSDVFYPLN